MVIKCVISLTIRFNPPPLLLPFGFPIVFQSKPQHVYTCVYRFALSKNAQFEFCVRPDALLNPPHGFEGSHKEGISAQKYLEL